MVVHLLKLMSNYYRILYNCKLKKINPNKLKYYKFNLPSFLTSS